MFVEYIVMIESRRARTSQVAREKEYQRNIYRALDLKEANDMAFKLRKQNFSDDPNIIEREAHVFAEFGMRGAKYRVRVQDFREFLHDVEAAYTEIEKDRNRPKLAATGIAAVHADDGVETED